MLPVEHITEQLWASAFATGDLRVTVDPAGDGWSDVERYWLVPNQRRAQLLLPRASSVIEAAAATHYRGLRRRHVNAIRSGGGVLARAGAPLGAHTARIQVRSDRPEAARRLPLALLAEELDRSRLYASIGVRTGANRKATLSLLDDDGAPVGYAKFGWNAIADGFVAKETEVLAALGGRSGAMRAPRLIGTLDYYGHPALVTEPLPLDVVGAHLDVKPPTSKEFYSLTPVHRRSTAIGTQHLVALQARLDELGRLPLTKAAAGAAARLMDTVRADVTELPVTTLWHGDLSSWNAARDGSGTLWVWDWETAEEDVVAGLDPFHWTFSNHRLAHRDLAQVDLAACLAEVSPHLAAAGVPRSAWGLVAACYVLTVVERACALAVHSGSWEHLWINTDALLALVRQAEGLVHSSERPR
ncbi:MAG TPA: hypothetical protein VLI04_17930 [Nocardioidaceae bacterium]|nr:hypothetical protein [Nocardioidaceae bacterium]